jgi:UPF0042 nucleotide-binding protein
MTQDRRTRPLVLVTGLSGAGRSTALKALEDEGYEAIDNLPVRLLASLIDESKVDSGPLAVAVDVRSPSFVAETFLESVEQLRSRKDLNVSLVFLDCEPDALQRRFTETRRPHPMARAGTLVESIAAERMLMQEIRAQADIVIDTTHMLGAELKRTLAGHLAVDDSPRLSVSVVSFSYRMGLPRNADLVFDVRFLSNPHYVESLRDKTGRDEDVAAFIEEDPCFLPFFSRLSDLVQDLLPAYTDEGKRYLTIAIGCTGGRHRSVFVAERLAALLSEEGQRVSLQHRELAS